MAARLGEHYGAGGVGLVELHAFGGELIDVGRFMINAIVGGYVAPAHVVDEENDEVGFVRFRGYESSDGEKESGGEGETK